LDATLDEQQMLIWKRMLQSAFVMCSLDGGLALLHPTSALRKRIFIMISLLETEPALAHHFLPQNRGIGYLLWLMVKMVWAILTAIVGVVLVKLWCVK